MAKKSSKSNSTTIVGVLSGIFIILAALIAQFFFGADILGDIDVLDEVATQIAESNETSNDTTQGNTANNNVVVSDTGQFSLFFTNPLNTSDRSQHVGSPIEEAVIASINGAQTSVDAAFYELNLERVSQALIDAQARGVTVRMVVDDEAFVEEEELQPDDSTLDMFEAAGFELYCEDTDHTPSSYDMRCDDRSALMHNKFIIIDGSTIWMGSMNMTHNGVYNNNNNFMRVNSTRLAQNYQFMFNEMFGGTFSVRGNEPYAVPFRNLNVSEIPIEQYYSPEDGEILEARILELINEAQSSIRVMTFNLTLDTIGAAIVDRLNAGVDVSGVFEVRGSLQGQMPVLGCEGAAVRQDGNPNTMHHKVIIIDESIVITGSFNFSENAKNNSENVLIIHSSDIAADYLNEFNRVFSQGEEVSRTEMGCS